MKNRNRHFELGGFAESPDALEEKTEEAFEAFNFCLAYDYIVAIYNEDFLSIGLMNNSSLDDILKWYVYGGLELTEEDIESIRTGKIITTRGRSLLDAVIEDQNDCFAFTFICNGNYDPRLVALCVEEDKYTGLLNPFPESSLDEYLEFLNDVFQCVDSRYLSLHADDKISVLSVIKDNVLSIRYPKAMGLINIHDDVFNYQFIKDIKNEK